MAHVIITFAEQRDGRLRRASLETLAEAGRLARTLGGQVEAVVIGAGTSGLAEELGRHGAARVHVFDDPALAAYATEPYARALQSVVAERQPWAVLVPHTAMGKDLAPRVAAKAGAGMASDCVGLSVEGGKLAARRAMYSGKALASVRFESVPAFASLRPNVFAPGAGDATGAPEVVRRSVDASARARVVSVQAKAAGKLELTEAQIIVSGGRGLRGPEHFPLVEALAAAMGAAVGASRAVVDAGWVDHQYQVGQTGKTVSPTLYVACGISGAIQHLAGMSSSKVIVAINKDADAPIFKVANYGILGDLFEVVPHLTEAARAHFAAKS
jgi:electron transfer flavoprotein alpha subunit